MLAQGRVTPEELERLNRECTCALRLHTWLFATIPLAEFIARKVIEIGAKGTRDPAEIARAAIK